MLKITEPAASVNRSKTRDVRRDATRLRQLRRILTLIDIMAPCRLFHATEEIRCHLCERLGENVHQRTFLRDLHLLESLGMAERQPADNCLHSRRFRWRLNLRSSESAQCAAIRLEAAEAFVSLQAGDGEMDDRQDLGEATASDDGIVKVHAMQYTNDRGKQVWFNQAMDADTAEGMRARFERMGRSPVVFSGELAAASLVGGRLHAAKPSSNTPAGDAAPESSALLYRDQVSDGDRPYLLILLSDGKAYVSDHPVSKREAVAELALNDDADADAHWLMWPADKPYPAWLEEIIEEPPTNNTSVDAFEPGNRQFDLFVVSEDQARRTSVRVSRQVAVTVTERFNEPDSQLFMWPSDAELPAWLTAILVEPERDDCSEWRILTCDAITGDLHRGEKVLSKQEVLNHFKAWNSQREQAVAIPWPAWAPEPVIRVPVED